MSSKGRVAVITGGAAGVGRCLGQQLAKRGARVVLTDISPDRLEATASALRAEGGDVVGIASDVTSAESVQSLADQVFDRYGAVNLLFNNAGVGLGDSRGSFWSLPLEDWRWGFGVHVMGAVHGIKAFVPRMIEGGQDGFVVNTTSGNGALTSIPSTPIYASSKAALASLTEVLYEQLKTAAPQIKVGLLFPGPSLVNTDLLASPRPKEYLDPKNPPPPGRPMSDLAEAMGRIKMTEPDEVAAFAIRCVENDQFWMLPEGSNLDKFRVRFESVVNRSNPA